MKKLDLFKLMKIRGGFTALVDPSCKKKCCMSKACKTKANATQ